METVEVNQQHHGFWRNLREWVQVIVIALIIALPIRFYIAEPFVVNGASMDPTFSTGQFLIVDRVTYRLEEPKRNQVIVFKYPNDPSVYYIKRIIGLPNETIDIANGKVSVTEPNSTTSMPVGDAFVDPAHASHDTYHIKLGPTEYFVMGDNRAQSSDSRAWGPLDKKFIIGQPVVRLIPLNVLSFWPGTVSNN